MRLQSTTLLALCLALAACSSSASNMTRPGGLTGLASAFLVAGVGGVIGSLWDVEDAGSAQLMVALHEALAAGDPPAEALRSAQLRLIASDVSGGGGPAVWAAFQFVGR